MPSGPLQTSWSIFGALGSGFATTEAPCRAVFAPSRMGSTLMSATSMGIFAPARHVFLLISASAANGSFFRSTANMHSANWSSFAARPVGVAEKFQSDFKIIFHCET